MKNNSLIKTWEKCYQVTLGTRQNYSRRLRELREWDKPIGTPSNDPSGKWREWACKIEALEGLVQESKP